MLNKKFTIILFAMTISVLGSVQATNYTPAKLLESSLPTPFKDSGVIELTFMVDKFGEVKESAILRSTLPDYFEKEAMRALSKYKYQPAMLNSEPIGSRQTARLEFDHSRVSNRFGFTNPMDAPEGYMSLYNKLAKQLKKSEPNKRKATNTLKKLMELPYKTFFTSVHTELAQYQFHLTFGTKEQRLESLLNVIMYEDVEWGGKRALDQETKSTIQIGVLGLMLELGQNAEFIEKYNEYSKGNEQIVEEFSPYIDRVSKIQLSDEVIARRATISLQGSTFLTLLKRTFFIEVAKGEVEEFLLRCDTKFLKVEFKRNEQYQLPESWGTCQLQLVGEPLSLVKVIQQ